MPSWVGRKRDDGWKSKKNAWLGGWKGKPPGWEMEGRGGARWEERRHVQVWAAGMKMPDWVAGKEMPG